MSNQSQGYGLFHWSMHPVGLSHRMHPLSVNYNDRKCIIPSPIISALILSLLYLLQQLFDTVIRYVFNRYIDG